AAVVVDDLALPALKDLDDEVGINLMLVELKVSLATYLATRDAEVKTLADVIAFNRRNADSEMPWFGQELLEKAEETSGVASAASPRSVTSGRRCSRTTTTGPWPRSPRTWGPAPRSSGTTSPPARRASPRRAGRSTSRSGTPGTPSRRRTRSATRSRSTRRS